MSYTSCAGSCTYDNFKLEYQIVSLEFVRNTSIKIEAICYDPYSKHLDKELTLKYNTNNLNSSDNKLKIVLSIIDSLIKNLDLPKENLYKLVVKNKQVFYIIKLCTQKI